LLGSIDAIRARVAGYRDAGFDAIAISPAVNEPEQLELIAAATSDVADLEQIPEIERSALFPSESKSP
jgi:hypothetical protein